jgi:hypothetical protein
MSDVRNGKSWICAVLGVAFAALGISGLIMLLPLNTRPDLKSLHVVMGIVFILAGAVHLALNGKTFITHFRNRSAIIAATAAALVAVALLFVGEPEGSGPHRYGNGYERTGIGADAPGSLEDAPRGFWPGGRFGNGRSGGFGSRDGGYDQ